MQDFSGGINKSTTVDNIADNEMDEALNMNLNTDKSISTRKGVDQYNSTLTGASRVTSIYYARNSAGTSTARIVTTLAKIYKDDGAGGWTDITGGTAPPSNTLWQWRTFNNLAIGVNGTSVPQKYAFGAACADLTGSPPDKCKAIEIYQGRVYLAADADEPTALHGSAAGLAEDWTAVGDAFKIFVDKDNGHPIIGIVKFYSDLIIFKRKGVYRLDNPTNVPTAMRIVQIFDDVGCVSLYSIKQIGNELVWLDDDGVYTLRTTQESGDVAYSSVSKKIQPYIEDMQQPLLNEAYSYDVRRLNQYRLIVPKVGASQNNHVLVRDYFHGAWLRHEGINFASYGRWDISSIFSDMAGGYDGKVYKLDTTENDEGADFKKNVRSKRFTFGTGRVRKLFHRVYQEYQLTGTYALGLTADIDYSKVTKGISLLDTRVSNLWDVDKWDVAKWGGSSIARKEMSIGRKGRSILFQYYNQTKDQPFTLYKFEFNASLLSRRG